MYRKLVECVLPVLIGIVHFSRALDSARYRSLKAASSDGKCPRVLMIFRSWKFSDSIAFVMQIAFRMSRGNARNGITRCQLDRQDFPIIG